MQKCFNIQHLKWFLFCLRLIKYYNMLLHRSSIWFKSFWNYAFALVWQRKLVEKQWYFCVTFTVPPWKQLRWLQNGVRSGDQPWGFVTGPDPVLQSAQLFSGWYGEGNTEISLFFVRVSAVIPAQMHNSRNIWIKSMTCTRAYCNILSIVNKKEIILNVVY